MWTGHRYSIEYVTKLHNMVKENLTLDHQFVCLTDKPHLHKIKGIEFKQAPVAVADSWCKLSLFVPQLADAYKGNKTLYLDLDVVVTAKLDGMVKNSDPEKLTIIKDGNTYDSSVMIWEMGKWCNIYNGFKPSDTKKFDGYHGLIKHILTDESVKTFGKVEIQNYEADNLKEKFNPQTKVVVFNSKLRPHQVGGWVTDYWK